MAIVFALIHGEPGAYGISFPDFPGAVSGGSTVAEAVERGREGLSLHIESMRIDQVALPKLRDIAEIRSDRTLAEDLKDAVTIAAVDFDLPGRAIRVNISMDEGLLARVDRRASDLGESRSGFLAAAAKARLAI